MIKYLSKVQEILMQIWSYDIQQISRSENAQADQLVKLATSQMADLNNMVHIEILEASSTEEPMAILCTNS